MFSVSYKKIMFQILKLVVFITLKRKYSNVCILDFSMLSIRVCDQFPAFHNKNNGANNP